MTLVTPAQVRDLDATLLDVRFWLNEPGRGREAWLAGHIPGAAFVDLDADLAGPGSGRHPLPDPQRFQAAMRRCGVSASRTVVVYDQAQSLGAGRAWWLLTHFGHPDVRVLDGGFAAWERAGGEIETGEISVAPGDFVAGPGLLPTVDAAGIPSLIASGHRLVDVRAPERFRGETEPIDPVAGHIPGAVNLPATTLFRPDGRFLPQPELRAALSGVRPGDAVSCGSGITASQVLLALDAAGVPDVRLYPGSWSDWITDPARPIAVRE